MPWLPDIKSELSTTGYQFIPAVYNTTTRQYQTVGFLVRSYDQAVVWADKLCDKLEAQTTSLLNAHTNAAVVLGWMYHKKALAIEDYKAVLSHLRVATELNTLSQIFSPVIVLTGLKH